MDGKSLNITEAKLGNLKKIIPEAFSEGKIDWEKLKAALGDDIEFKNERYVLNWAGKSDAFRVLQAPTTATLAPDEKESVNFSKTENVFIEGENLEVLKVLQKAYFGKIKMIYIDPPYNTGNDNFIYPDKFSETREEYLERIGDKDETGYMTREGLFRKNSKDSGHYHSNWLSMMYPRLFLARNLLRDDGVIFISIDDNEVHNLRMVMNEIFGEENFVCSFIWNTKKGAQGMATKNMIVPNHEYILVFTKHMNEFKFLGLTRETEGFSNPDNDSRGLWKRQYLQRLGQGLPERTIIDPETGNKFTFETPYTQEKLEKWIEEKRIIFPKDKSKYPARKEFLEEYENNQQLITDIGLFATKATTEKLYGLFEKVKIFTNPKPDSLIKFLLNVATKSDDIILDFFAGSGTTAHAVLGLNKEDGGNRKFICVQLPEKCDEKSEAYKAGYKTIADIGKERIRRVIKKIKKDGEGKLKFDGETGKQDLGFKVFKLRESNFKIWRQDIKTEEELKAQMQTHIDPLDENAKTENVLYELLLKSGVPLTAKIEKKNEHYWVSDGEIALILEKVDKAIIKKVIAEKPRKVITLDRLFKNNDQLKTNTALQMKDAEIDFKTV